MPRLNEPSAASSSPSEAAIEQTTAQKLKALDAHLSRLCAESASIQKDIAVFKTRQDDWDAASSIEANETKLDDVKGEMGRTCMEMRRLQKEQEEEEDDAKGKEKADEGDQEERGRTRER